jgi:hypothetical protein
MPLIFSPYLYRAFSFTFFYLSTAHVANSFENFSEYSSLIYRRHNQEKYRLNPIVENISEG